MILLQVADLKFGYAGDTLFEKVTFAIESGDRVCIVAPNGAGKSTLLRLIAGELEPDAGTAVIKRDTKVAYYRQSHEVAAEGDVLGAFLSGFKEIVELRAELSRVQHEAASGSTRSLSALAEITDRYHTLRGDELERHVSMLAQKLGFAEKDLSRPVASLSGGERGRLNLGVVLAQEADLLMLDEPTNHLDLDTITWLEDFLLSYRGGVVVVSHDRAFLDRVCPKTMELGSRDVRIYPLKYSDYALAREDDLARERAVLERQQAFIDKTEDFIRKNIAGQKTKQAQSRRKMLEKLDRVDRPEDVWAIAEKIAFRFSPAARSGDIVLDCTDLAASRGGRVLFSGVELLVRRGERIGIVGPNGSGKSTLLKLLAGRSGLMNHEARAPEARTEPEDTGKIKRGTNLQQGYFDQHLGEVNPNLIATEEIRTVRGDFTTEAARQYLARFRFYGDDPLRVVSGYSGGEKSRLALAKLLLEPRNLLFLDEPTNHLDIPAAEILEEAIGGFEGTVLLVSHDRRFLEKTATRIISVRDGKVDIYPGGFRDYVAAHTPKEEMPVYDRGRQQRKKQSAPPPPPKDDRKKPVPHGDAAGRSAFEAQKNATREKERKKRRIVELEQTIASGEKELTRLREELREDPKGNWEKVAQLAKAEQSLVKRVDAMMSEWAQLSEDKS